jgi:hypothetical protein
MVNFRLLHFFVECILFEEMGAEPSVTLDVLPHRLLELRLVS